jgi:protease I
MDKTLEGCKVAILVMDGFEEAELMEPRQALSEAGAMVHVISNKPGQIQGFRHLERGSMVTVDATFDQVSPDDYDAVVLPGGVVNGDAIRTVPEAQAFVRALDTAHKPVAVICHGGWLPISAGIVKGHTMTSWPSLQDDLRNAGATWVDEEVVEDDNLITSRKPDDIPAFNRKIIERLAQQGRAA